MWAATALRTLDQAAEDAGVGARHPDPAAYPHASKTSWAGLTSSGAALTDSGARLPLGPACRPTPIWDSPPWGLKQLSLGALREGLQLAPHPSKTSAAAPKLTYLILLLAPRRDSAVSQATQDCPVGCSQPSKWYFPTRLSCSSFPRYWGLGCSEQRWIEIWAPPPRAWVGA